jgi:hypothetical protein
MLGVYLAGLDLTMLSTVCRDALLNSYPETLRWIANFYFTTDCAHPNRLFRNYQRRGLVRVSLRSCCVSIPTGPLHCLQVSHLLTNRGVQPVAHSFLWWARCTLSSPTNPSIWLSWPSLRPAA